MKKIKLIGLILCLPILLVGCAGKVPPTVLEIPGLGNLKLVSPKQVIITNFVAEVATNGVRVSFSGLQSKNDPDIVGAVTAANAAMAQNYADLVKAIVGSPALQGALKAAGAASGVPVP